MTNLCPLRCGRLIEGNVCPECLRALQIEAYGHRIVVLAFGKKKGKKDGKAEQYEGRGQDHYGRVRKPRPV